MRNLKTTERSKAGKFMAGRPTRTQRGKSAKSSILIVIVIEIETWMYRMNRI